MLLANVPLDVVLPNISPITPNQATIQTVNADLPPSWDFQDIRALCLGVDPTNMQEVRVLANGNPIIRIPGTMLDGLLQYFGSQAFGTNVGGFGASSILTIPFSRLGVRSGSMRGNAGPVASSYAKDLAYETSVNAGILTKNGAGIRSVRLEIDLINTGAGPCSIQLLGRCLPQDQERAGAGLVPRIDRQSITVTAGQQVNLSKNALLFGDPLHTLFFGLMLVPAAGTLDNFVLRYNGEQWFINRTGANNAFIQSVERHRFPVAGQYWIDPGEAGFGDEFLPIGDPGTDLQVQFTPSDTGSIDIYQYGAGFVS